MANLYFGRTLSPGFSIECYLREEEKLLKFVSEIPGHLSLTVMDTWSSHQNRNYVLLTAHFIDHDWKLQRRVLSFVELPSPDSDTAYSNAIASCLADWNAKGKLLTVTVDRANENSVKHVRGQLKLTNPNIVNGQLVINSCLASLLTSLAKDCISSNRATIEKLRKSVNYFKTLEVDEERFIMIKNTIQVQSAKILVIDDLTKWNTTYHMLVTAYELKEVFSCYQTSDPDYKLNELSMDEWGQVATLCKYLGLFYESANILTSPTYTSNLLFNEVWEIHLELRQARHGPGGFTYDLVRHMQEKVEKFYKDCMNVLAIAVVMDPRFKMELVKFCFSRIYSENAEARMKLVDKGVRDVYLTYLQDNTWEVPEMKKRKYYPDYGITELDKYLNESIVPRTQEFDVLGWWKANEYRYPNLAKMACDILSLPLSTLPPDCVFDTEERKIISNPSSLRSSTLEALVCAKDWHRYV